MSGSDRLTTLSCWQNRRSYVEGPQPCPLITLLGSGCSEALWGLQLDTRVGGPDTTCGGVLGGGGCSMRQGARSPHGVRVQAGTRLAPGALAEPRPFPPLLPCVPTSTNLSQRLRKSRKMGGGGAFSGLSTHKGPPTVPPARLFPFLCG